MAHDDWVLAWADDDAYVHIVSEEKGKQFLKLIDDQNNLQWKIVAKLSLLIESNWDSIDLQDELNDEGKPGLPLQMLQVLPGPSDEVVDSDHLVAFGEETVGQMGTQESPGTRDQHPHASEPFNGGWLSSKQMTEAARPALRHTLSRVTGRRPTETYSKPSSLICSGL